MGSNGVESKAGKISVIGVCFTMTKIEAIKEICWESGRDRVTKASLKRIRTAGKSLDLSADEQVSLEVYLDFRNRNEPHELHLTLK